MNSDNIESLKSELDKISSTLGIIGCAIVERNGLTIASHLPRTFNEKTIGAMTATMFESMESAIPEAEEKISNMMVEYEDFNVFITKVNSDFLYVGLVEINIDLGLALVEIEEFIGKITHFLKD